MFFQNSDVLSPEIMDTNRVHVKINKDDWRVECGEMNQGVKEGV